MTQTSDIIDLFETLVDDTGVDSVTQLTLLNQADAQIRRVRPWEILKALDSSKTRVAGETFANTKALPDDFDRPNKIFVGDNQLPPLMRVRLEEQQMYKNTAGVYMLDYKNKTLAITGPTQAGVIYNHYLYKPPQISLTVTPVFPDDFWPVYAYRMADIQMGGIDFDFIASQSSNKWASEFRTLWDAMVSWDADLKDDGDLLRSAGNDQPWPVDLGLLG